MKQKDIALLIVVGFISALFSVGISRFLITPKSGRNQTAEVVQPITPEFKNPDSKYFNQDSNNPTKRIQIEDNANKTPFNTKQQ